MISITKLKYYAVFVICLLLCAVLPVASFALNDSNIGVNNGIPNGNVADGNLGRAANDNGAVTDQDGISNKNPSDTANLGNEGAPNDGLGANDVPNENNGNADTPQEDLNSDGIMDGDTLDDINGGGDDGVTSDNHETVAPETSADAAESIENGNDGGFNVAGVVIAVIIAAAVIALIIILIPKKDKNT